MSTLIDLSHIVMLSLQIGNFFNYYSEATGNVYRLFKLANNVRSVKILISSNYRSIDDRTISICSLVPDHVRHVTISVSTLYQMHMALNHLKYISSIKFEYTNTIDNVSDMHLTWLKEQKRSYTYRLHRSSLCMWFNNRSNAVEEKND